MFGGLVRTRPRFSRGRVFARRIRGGNVLGIRAAGQCHWARPGTGVHSSMLRGTEFRSGTSRERGGEDSRLNEIASCWSAASQKGRNDSRAAILLIGIPSL